MTPNPTADWIQLNDRFYRKQEVYSLAWNQTDLSKYMIAAAQYGGPIGMPPCHCSSEKKKAIHLTLSPYHVTSTHSHDP
ncbi:hypothetical protein DM01DRAFT_1187510 [Hesseltinella vesiculosa]|uniref:Vps16 N-terminal domain-containing protein n=1 Tax=Hesseltinella vesiculosa TaxID=101127 RepID=A0A1X2GR28_9FUNG|nr:hypothetical protein DM01DRAFT_1187510 [Hesseltinella vesiculosa]